MAITILAGALIFLLLSLLAYLIWGAKQEIIEISDEHSEERREYFRKKAYTKLGQRRAIKKNREQLFNYLQGGKL